MGPPLMVTRILCRILPARRRGCSALRIALAMSPFEGVAISGQPGPTRASNAGTATLALLMPLAIATFGLSLAAARQPQSPDGSFVTPIVAPPLGAQEKIALGQLLFEDSRLSRSRDYSCASCHDLATNGASASARDRGDSGHPMRFNTPTVFNAGESFRLGWGGRSRNLRAFTQRTLADVHLMGAGDLAARRLSQDRAVAARFRAIYAGPPSGDHIADALAAYMETLVTPDAPFDRWRRGDRSALSAQQQRGLARFRELGCASCHQGRNVGANLMQRRGIFHPLGRSGPALLRVPSLRNVAVTAPYFHDGAVSSLPEAIRQMGRAQLDLTIAEQDVEDIAAFLGALTGTYQGRSLTSAKPAQPAKPVAAR